MKLPCPMMSGRACQCPWRKRSAGTAATGTPLRRHSQSVVSEMIDYLITKLQNMWYTVLVSLHRRSDREAHCGRSGNESEEHHEYTLGIQGCVCGWLEASLGRGRGDAPRARRAHQRLRAALSERAWRRWLGAIRHSDHRAGPGLLHLQAATSRWR